MRTPTRHILLVGALMAWTCMHGQDVPTSVIPATPADPGTLLPTATPADQNAKGAQPVVAAPVAGDGQDVEEDLAPIQAPVVPNASHEVVSADEIYTVHLRPLFATVIRLPEAVTSIAVGAPTLIAAEHSPDEAKLVFVKPTTHQPVDSDVIIALESGHTLAIHVISAGDAGSSDPVDFVVDYSQTQHLLLGDENTAGSNASLFQQNPSGRDPGLILEHAPAVQLQAAPRSRRNQEPAPAVTTISSPDPEPGITDATPVTVNNSTPAPAAAPAQVTLIDAAFAAQQEIAAPHYTSAEDLARVYPEDRGASPELGASLGRCVQDNDKVVVSFSVINRSSRWIEILPPLLEFNNPANSKKGKVDKKHPEALAEQVQLLDYRMTGTKLSPGQRLDGAVEFIRPDFKYRKEHLLLQIADASQVDTALLVPLPFIVPAH